MLAGKVGTGARCGGDGDGGGLEVGEDGSEDGKNVFGWGGDGGGGGGGGGFEAEEKGCFS